MNVVKFSFYRKNELIFRFDNYIIDNHVYKFHRFCVFQSIIQNIFIVVHDDNHSNFVRCYDKITVFYYIRDLFKYLKKKLNIVLNVKHIKRVDTNFMIRFNLYSFRIIFFTLSLSILFWFYSNHESINSITWCQLIVNISNV